MEDIGGVENLSIKERYKKSFLAGIDQYGGEDDPEHIIKLVDDGLSLIHI